MRITRLQLKNWKNFTNVDIKLSKRSFIVGANASGKSNLLDSFRFLHDISKPGGGLSKALADRGGSKKIRSLSARNPSQIEIKVEMEEIVNNKRISWSYNLALVLERHGLHRTLIDKEVVKRNGEIVLNRPDADDKKDPLRLTQTGLEQINVNSGFRELYTFFQEISYNHLVPQIIRQPELFFNTNVKIGDDSYGFHFMERIVKTNKKQRDARLKKIEKALRIAVPHLKNLTETRDENGVPHLEALYEHWRPNAGKQKESQFSDGTIRLIGFLWSILDAKSLLLLEEPELSLHPGIIRKIPQIISNLTNSKRKDIQILISTHSPDLLSEGSISAGEIIILDMKENGTEVKTAQDIEEVKVLLESGMGVDEVVLPYIAPKNVEQLELFT